MNRRLSNIRSVHTYVITWTVYFDWICMKLFSYLVPGVVAIVTCSNNCISACRTFLPGLTNIPKHLSTPNLHEFCDICWTLITTFFSKFERNLKTPFWRGTMSKVLVLSVFSLISRVTSNKKHSCPFRVGRFVGLTPIFLISFFFLKAWAKDTKTLVTASVKTQRKTWHWK